MIFKALWGIIKSLFGIVRWFFKKPVRYGKVEKPFAGWKVVGNKDILYKPDGPGPWDTGKLPLRIRRFIMRHSGDESFEPIFALVVGYDNRGRAVMEPFEDNRQRYWEDRIAGKCL